MQSEYHDENELTDDLGFDITNKNKFGQKQNQHIEFIQNLFYNSKTGAILGRTPSSWLFVTVFHFVFYALLAGLLAGLFGIMMIDFDRTTPRYNMDKSLLLDSTRSQVNPGLMFRPLPEDRSALIYYVSNHPETYISYLLDLKNYVRMYQHMNVLEQGRKGCKDGDGPSEAFSCNVDIAKDIGKVCGDESGQTPFGYDTVAPCVLLKLNKIYGWVPEPYEQCDSWEDCKTKNGFSEEELLFLRDEFLQQARTDTMVKDNLIDEIDMTKLNWQDIFDGKSVAITCEGMHDADKESIQKIVYTGQNGHKIPAFYFPYLNQIGHLSPVVAARFLTSRGFLVMIKCKAWAKNIRFNFDTKDGSTRFEMMVD